MYRAGIVRFLLPGAAGIFALIVAANIQTCFPAGKRLSAPVVCPSGTVTSVVVRGTTTNQGKTSQTSTLICIDADGGGRPASGGLIFLLNFSVAFALGGTILLGVRTLRGRRAGGRP